MNLLPRLRPAARRPSLRGLKRLAKRVVPVAVGLYFIPIAVAVAFGVGLLDFLRNRRRTLNSFDRYFFGNGVFTWLLAPFNLFVDLLCLPFRNRGIYKLADLPQAYQDEISQLIDAAHKSDLVGQLAEKFGDKKRGMMFFKWYGKNVDASVSVPEFHQQFRFIRTIGVSIFNAKQSTGKHYGPLRLTLRLLYNVNNVTSPEAYITVGKVTHRWCEEKLFIFDDTLQHQSCNGSDEVRYCLFVDVLRPSYVSRVLDALLACVRGLAARFNRIFYKHWTFMK
jgi:aspartyl/asparaginyl beta-hydroxylase (cupin superfamily)